MGFGAQPAVVYARGQLAALVISAHIDTAQQCNVQRSRSMRLLWVCPFTSKRVR